ncbi:MAG: hypothetical protein AAGJ80_05380, partial [Cyanobacteria bacterium J06553_1]
HHINKIGFVAFATKHRRYVNLLYYVTKFHRCRVKKSEYQSKTILGKVKKFHEPSSFILVAVRR